MADVVQCLSLLSRQHGALRRPRQEKGRHQPSLWRLQGSNRIFCGVHRPADVKRGASLQAYLIVLISATAAMLRNFWPNCRMSPMLPMSPSTGDSDHAGVRGLSSHRFNGSRQIVLTIRYTRPVEQRANVTVILPSHWTVKTSLRCLPSAHRIVQVLELLTG